MNAQAGPVEGAGVSRMENASETKTVSLQSTTSPARIPFMGSIGQVKNYC